MRVSSLSLSDKLRSLIFNLKYKLMQETDKILQSLRNRYIDIENLYDCLSKGHPKRINYKNLHFTAHAHLYIEIGNMSLAIWNVKAYITHTCVKFLLWISFAIKGRLQNTSWKH